MKSTGMTSLSDRELDVLRAMADGRSNDGIAGHLHVSVKTVEAMCRSIFRKLELDEPSSGENRRVKAVVRFLMEGPPPASQLPVPPTPFVGRKVELDSLAAVLESSPMLTLTGPGGIGKTRIAIELARRWSELGRLVRFIDLVGVVDEAGLVGAAALSIGNPNLTTSTASRRIAIAFGDQAGLVIFDNADEVTAHAARLVEQISSGSGRITVLATSRSPLGARGETVRPTHGMGTTDAIDLLRECSGATLAPRDEAVLCESVGGLPLAIELLAARLATVPPGELVERSDDLVRLLATAPGSGREHLGSVLDDALVAVGSTAAEAVRRLSVFPGGFDADAARAVLGDIDAAEVLPPLVSAALVSFDGDRRYRVLEPIRQHSSESLRNSSVQDDSLRGLVSWCVALVRSVRPPGTARIGMARRDGDRISAERANIEASVRSALATDDVDSALEIVGHLGLHWAMTGPRGWQPLVTDVLDAAADRDRGSMLGGAYLAAGMVDVRAHDPRCIGQLQAALQMFNGAGNDEAALFTEYWLLRASFGLIGSFDESIRRADEVGEQRVKGYLLEAKARHSYLDGAPIEDLLEWLNEAEKIGRLVDPELTGTVLINQANRLLDLDHLAGGGTDRSQVQGHATEAGRIALTASTTYELCEVLLLDYRIEQRFGSFATAHSAAIGVLEAAVAREATIAASIALMYAGDLVARANSGQEDELSPVARELQRMAAAYMNDRPGGRSRLVADNFPTLIAIEPAGINDGDVLSAATTMIELLQGIDPP